MATAVRLAGRIIDWNDDKGFGFVEPNGGGTRAFVHINEFRRGSRRPVAGDLVSYLPHQDARGRPSAKQVRHAGQKLDTRQAPSRVPRALLGVAAVLLGLGAAALGMMPAWLAAAYVVLSGVSYLMYWHDKSAAQAGARRTPESNLHLVGFLGGWPGALVAQQRFRHKTAKASFQAVFWATVVLNLAAVGWLVSSGMAAEWAQSFSG